MYTLEMQRRHRHVHVIYVFSKSKKKNLKINIFTAFKNLCIMHGNVCVLRDFLLAHLGLTRLAYNIGILRRPSIHCPSCKFISKIQKSEMFYEPHHEKT